MVSVGSVGLWVERSPTIGSDAYRYGTGVVEYDAGVDEHLLAEHLSDRHGRDDPWSLSSRQPLGYPARRGVDAR